MVEDDRERLGLLPLAIPLVVFREKGELTGDGRAVVAGGDKLCEAKLVEVSGEVFEEVALERFTAAALDNLVATGVAIEFQIGLDPFLDVHILSIKLVLLRYICSVQICILGTCRHLRNYATSDRMWLKART